MKTILFVGGTGAQGAAIIRILVSTGQYHILLFTRDVKSKHSTDLIATGHVEAIENNAEHGYDLAAFELAVSRSDGVYINTDGFALGEQAETYWGIRLYESAVKCGTKHILYSGLDNSWRSSKYDPSLYVGHYQGKARVQDFIRAQPASESAWTITRSGPYMEMLSEALVPSVDASSGVYSFTLPLGDGAVPFIHLDDFGRYVDWIFSNPKESAGMDLGISTAHISGQEIADAFGDVAGKHAVYNDIPASAWSSIAFQGLPDGHDTKVGYTAGQDATTLNQTYAENFGNWWNLYKASAGNRGLIQRDYQQLDGILPSRVRSVREWMEKTGYSGERLQLLKRESDLK